MFNEIYFIKHYFFRYIHDISSFSSQLRQALTTEAHFVRRQYSWYLIVTPILQALRWTSVEQRRSDARATTMYRIHYNLIDIPAVMYLQSNIKDTRGHQLKYHLPASTVLAHRHSFFPATIRIWNALPSHVVLAPSLETVRTSLVSSG